MQKFLNIPYKPAGRDYSGCDCYGLIYLFYRDFLNKDIKKFDIYDDCKIIQISNILNTHKKEFFQVTNPHNFDIILFRRKKFDLHVGIFLTKSKMLHISESIKFSAITGLQEYQNCEREYYRC